MTHDPGGKSRWRLLPGVIGTAEFHGEHNQARLTLDRTWGHGTGALALWIGQNPSTALADEDDPTVRKEQTITRREGLCRFRKMNVTPYRATDPARLTPAIVARHHEANMAALRRSIPEAAWIVAAWGAIPPFQRPYAREMIQEIRGFGHRILCLGTTKDGSPRHPCRLANATPLEPWAHETW